MPRELNFFDTNPLSFVLEQKLIWDRFLYKSLCIEVLKRQDRTEPVVVVGVTISNVRIKHTRIRPIIAIATTFDKRFRRYSLIPIEL